MILNLFMGGSERAFVQPIQEVQTQGHVSPYFLKSSETCFIRVLRCIDLWDV